MLEDTKVYTFPEFELAKKMAGVLREIGYEKVLVVGEVGDIDPRGRLPENTKWIVLATNSDVNFVELGGTTS